MSAGKTEWLRERQWVVSMALMLATKLVGWLVEMRERSWAEWKGMHSVGWSVGLKESEMAGLLGWKKVELMGVD
jgi:hypothetical protein